MLCCLRTGNCVARDVTKIKMPAMLFSAGEAHLVYTISPRRDSVPGGHASQECMLACHVQVSEPLVEARPAG